MKSHLSTNFCYTRNSPFLNIEIRHLFVQRKYVCTIFELCLSEPGSLTPVALRIFRTKCKMENFQSMKFDAVSDFQFCKVSFLGNDVC